MNYLFEGKLDNTVHDVTRDQLMNMYIEFTEKLFHERVV